jgi:hypothetical protein
VYSEKKKAAKCTTKEDCRENEFCAGALKGSLWGMKKGDCNVASPFENVKCMYFASNNNQGVKKD